MNEITFVRGMAWHDVAKPFFLRNARHSRSGFMLLAAAGFREEGTVALCHISGGDLRHNLKQYYQLGGPALSALLLLASPLDRLAASTYSFMAQPPKQPPYHAWHNPFTHLAEVHPQLNLPFQVRNLALHFEEPLRAHLLAEAPPAWQASLTEVLERGYDEQQPLVEVSLPAVTGPRLLDLVLPYSNNYPERTYAPVNDTLLSAHTRLSAVLAWVVYRNLVAQSASLLDWTLTLGPDSARLPDGTDAVDFVSPRDGTAAFSDGQVLVRDHLASRLVRISLSGHRQWVDEAARLDDLKGAQQLTSQFRAAFKRAFAQQLGIDDLADFLWLSESTFDLVYLLPEALGDPAALIQRSYEQAVAWLVEDPANPDSLRRLLDADFRRADPPLQLTEPDALAALKAELACLGYSLSVVRVQPPGDLSDYGAFTAAFGQTLLEAYQTSLTGGQASPASLQMTLETLAATETLTAEDVCSICNTHPVYRPLADRVGDDYFLRKVTHTFRDDPDRPCLSCIARRALAHKQVQVDVLHQMIHHDPETGELQTEPATDPNLDLPPMLLHTGQLIDADDYLDLRAAFVRLARSQHSQRALDIFPTISYAADSLGNVALLTLQATSAVFEAYDYRRARQRVQELTEIERQTPAWSAFEQDFEAFCRRVATQSPDLLDQVEVIQPHPARVLAREARISRFFAAVASALEGAGIRALALETTYPLGRWLVPAMLLPKALKCLSHSLARDLLAVPDEALTGPTRIFLAMTVPALLEGSVVVFKQKYPIYLVLEAARTLQIELKDRSDLPPAYGLRLGFTDLRGILSSASPRQALVTLGQLPELLALNETVDRRSVTLRVADLDRSPESEWAQQVADARLYVRSSWWGLPEAKRQAVVQALMEQETFDPIIFFKTVART